MVLAGCAVMTLCIISFQLKMGWRQTDISQSQLVNQTRAWITVKAASYEEIEEGKEINYTVTFVNSGNSPALNLTTHIECEISNTPVQPPREFTVRDNNPSKAVVGPGGTFLAGGSDNDNTILTEELVEKIKRGDLSIYVWAVVKYDDIFGQQRETGYCGTNRLGTTYLDICRDGNYAN